MFKPVVQQIEEDGLEQSLSTEERLAALEKEVVELKQQLTERLSFERLRTDVKELQVRYQAHEEYVTDRLNDFEEHVETRLDLMTTRIDVMEDNNNARFDAIESRLTTLAEGQQELQAGQIALQSGQLALQSGQEQILAILTGKARMND